MMRIALVLGFVTDLASIPPAQQSIIQQNGDYLLPAVVHDYLYWKQTCTRAQADGIFRLAMIEHKVAAKRPRVIPVQYLQIPANVSWESYQQQLVMAGVAEGPDLPVSQTFCARGEMPVERALKP